MDDVCDFTYANLYCYASMYNKERTVWKAWQSADSDYLRSSVNGSQRLVLFISY